MADGNIFSFMESPQEAQQRLLMEQQARMRNLVNANSTERAGAGLANLFSGVANRFASGQRGGGILNRLRTGDARDPSIVEAERKQNVLNQHLKSAEAEASGEYGPGQDAELLRSQALIKAGIEIGGTDGAQLREMGRAQLVQRKQRMQEEARLQAEAEHTQAQIDLLKKQTEEYGATDVGRYQRDRRRVVEELSQMDPNDPRRELLQRELAEISSMLGTEANTDYEFEKVDNGDGSTSVLRINPTTGELEEAYRSDPEKPGTDLEKWQVEAWEGAQSTNDVLGRLETTMTLYDTKLRNTRYVGPGWAGNVAVPSKEALQFDADMDLLRQQIRAQTRIPGEGSMSEKEMAVALAMVPSRNEREEVIERKLKNLQSYLRGRVDTKLRIAGPDAAAAFGGATRQPTAPMGAPGQDGPIQVDDEGNIVE